MPAPTTTGSRRRPRAGTSTLRSTPVSPSRAPLAGRVAIVAGATRGAGRGIARGLAEAGAIVYCTGRSVKGQPSPYKRKETIDQTAELIAAAGGTAIPVRVDHTVESEVEALFARVLRERKRVDVVVDSVAGEDPSMRQWGHFWDVNIAPGELALRQGLISHIITAKHAARAMMPRRSGLIVEVTENDVLGGGGNPFSQAVKTSLKLMAGTMGVELRPHDVAAVAVTPGYLRSESMLEGYGVTEATWREAGKKDPNFLESESPLYLGRGVAALAADPDVLAHTGGLLSSWELARRYGVTDYDGRRPDWGSHAIDWSGHPAAFVEMFRTGWTMQVEWLRALTQRTENYLAKLPAAKARVASARQRRGRS
jgi:NAD(P)-dependent dehydrogenase (short-subunit alcohol dehydrogenase family)